MANICVIRQWYFPHDPRVSREIDALLRVGHRVDLICAGQPGQPRIERSERLSIYRLPIARRRGSRFRYLFEFGTFLAAAGLIAGALHLRRRFDLVQVNTIPDSLVFAAAIPRLLGAKVLLDLHECMPEFFMTKYRLSPRHALVRTISSIEQAAIRFADTVITCTDQMRERFVERGATREKIAVILNSANEDTFAVDAFPATIPSPERFVLVCHGTIEEIFGVDTVVRAVALLKNDVPGLRLRIFGDGSFRPAIEALITELGVQDHVQLSRGFVPMPELVKAIAEADAGVVPTKRDSFRDLVHCNKMFDFIAMRKPALVARTPAVEAYFDSSCFQMFESRNERDLARAIRELYADASLRDRLAQRATEVSQPYRWVHQRRRYLEVVESLTSDAAAGVQAPIPARQSEAP